MDQTVFYSGLDEFCRKFLVKVPNKPEPTVEEFKKAWDGQERAIFEHLMLFNQVCFRVKGESILIGVLNQMLGPRSFNALLEQRAIRFVLWDQDVLYLANNVPGVHALGAARYNSPAHSDPYESVSLGLGWWRAAPVGWQRKRFTRKLVKLYEKPDAKMCEKAVVAVNEAALSGRLSHYGVNVVGANLDNLTLEQKLCLTRCAEDYCEYGYVLKEGMTSFAEYKYFSPFWDTAAHIKQGTRTVKGFADIVEMENIPNLRDIYGQVDKPMARLADIRQTSNAISFRKWMAETTGQNPDQSLTQAYIDELTNRRGPLSSGFAKFVSKVALGTFGVMVGSHLFPEMSPTLTAVAGE